MIEVDNKLVLTIQDIVQDTDPKLRLKSVDVRFPLNSNLLKLVDDMKNYLYYSNDEQFEESDQFVRSIGLAAPQVGQNVNIIVVRLLFKEVIDIDVITGETDYEFLEKDLVMINPVVVGKSANLTFLEDGEACLSVKAEHPGYIHRHYKISVKYFDELGQSHQEVFYGINAVVIQHEIDHLNGVLFYDHINLENPFLVSPNSKPLGE